MKNEQKKSAEQTQLSNATQKRLFANQKHLYPNDTSILNFHQRNEEYVETLGRVAMIAFKHKDLKAINRLKDRLGDIKKKEWSENVNVKFLQ